MKSCALALGSMCALLVALVPPALRAQNSIPLFSPIDVRHSQANTGLGASELIFNTTTLNLTCPASPVAVLSSAASLAPGTANAGLLVDNLVNFSNLTTGLGPQSLCQGAPTTSAANSGQSCFSLGYEIPAESGRLISQNPDNLVATGGVPAIDISKFLVAGAQKIKIDLVDEGDYVASSSIVLNTNCTSGGVVGPALISGNPIYVGTMNPKALDQSFTFNATSGQVVSLIYNLQPAETSGTLTINQQGVIPQVSDLGIDPAAQYPKLVSGTSFATSACLVHTGELLNGSPACKLYTLDCTVGDGSTATGAQCPVSSLPNEILQDVFDGPAFTLPDISVPNGPTFHEGVGFLEASEGWTGGPCMFDAASGLQATLCPQNLLTSFSGPGIYTGTGQTTHPNSTFISIVQVPEDLTTVKVTNSAGQPLTLGPGNWTNNSSPSIQLSSQPPYLTGTNLANASSFVAAPIETITYGISAGTTPPAVGSTGKTDTVLTNPAGCPTKPTANPASFTSPIQPLNHLADGDYLVHYFAKDCAGTEELKFVEDNKQAWSTNFYTYPINIDTVPPQVVSGPTLSKAGPFYSGEVVTVTYSCTDDRSGIVQCGSKTFSPGVLSTGIITDTLPTSGSGQQTFTVTAVDAAGNQTTKSVTYQLTGSSQVMLSLSSKTITYPQSVTATIKVTPSNGVAPGGTVKILDSGKVIGSTRLTGGSATYTIVKPAAGTHTLTASYSGDANNPPSTSLPVTLTVLPAPVSIALFCSDSPISEGDSFYCLVYTTSTGGAPTGLVNYSLDGGATQSVPLFFGLTLASALKPAAGPHTLSVTYPAQSNFAAAGPATESFTVTPLE